MPFTCGYMLNMSIFCKSSFWPSNFYGWQKMMDQDLISYLSLWH